MYTEKAVKTAISLGRLWGISETLEEIPAGDPEDVIRMLYGWTQEYMEAEGGRQDIVTFFLKKKETCRNL